MSLFVLFLSSLNAAHADLPLDEEPAPVKTADRDPLPLPPIPTAPVVDEPVTIIVSQSSTNVTWTTRKAGGILCLFGCSNDDNGYDPNVYDELLIVSFTLVSRDGVPGQSREFEYPVGINSCEQFFTTKVDGVYETETCKDNNTFVVSVDGEIDQIEIFAPDSEAVVISAEEYIRLPRFLIGNQVLVFADLELRLK